MARKKQELTQDEKYIKKCIALADKAAKKGDIPVGALVVVRLRISPALRFQRSVRVRFSTVMYWVFIVCRNV